MTRSRNLRTLTADRCLGFAGVFAFAAALGLTAVACDLNRTADEEVARESADVAVLPSDSQLERDITRALEADPAVNASEILVGVSDQIALLRGTVGNLLASERAVEIARRTLGVRAAVDELTIAPVERSDEEIERDVRQALADDAATRTYEVTTAVNGGAVTLSGTVGSDAQRRLAEHVVKGVAGVRSVDNTLLIAGVDERTPDRIQADVRARLETDPQVDGNRVRVEVAGSTVTLRGTVNSLAQKARVLRDAWVDGVQHVVDDDVMVDATANEPFREPSREILALTDAELQRSVRDALRLDPRVTPFRVDVGVIGRIATLAGTVDNLAARRAAIEDARNTKGVDAVRDYLVVVVEPETSEHELSRRVATALARDPYLRGREIEVDALDDDGAIALSGRVANGFERWHADSVAARIRGVAAIANRLQLGPVGGESGDSG